MHHHVQVQSQQETKSADATFFMQQERQDRLEILNVELRSPCERIYSLLDISLFACGTKSYAAWVSLTEKNKQRVLWPLVADVSGYASRGVWQTFGDTAMRSQHRHFANGVVDLFIEAGDANGNIDRFRYSMESFCLKP
jgi:hypothetical protein